MQSIDVDEILMGVTALGLAMSAVLWLLFGL